MSCRKGRWLVLEWALEQAKPLLKKLIDNGYQAYFVGGAVRDSLMGRPIHDVDIATSAHPDQVQALFEETVPIGLAHGTVLVLFNGMPYEVTTFRSEGGYTDHRHPDQVFFEERIEVDLSRRDFTMNAMAYSLDGELIDPFKGREDLRQNILRTVGDPRDRFQEDPLRMLRAARFVSQLDVEPAGNLSGAMNSLADRITTISIERVRDELIKCLRGVSPKKGLALLIKTNLYAYIYGLKDLKERWSTLEQASFPLLQTDVERLTLFFYGLNPHLEEAFLRRFYFSNKEKKAILQLLHLLNQDEELTPYLLYKWGIDCMTSVERLKQALGRPSTLEDVEGMWRDLPIRSQNELCVGGRDLLSWSTESPGPWVAALLSEIEENVVTGRLKNTTTAIRKWVQMEWMKKRN
jgi:tRNA nucleotidyltransferase (CCA-adding enzyme)